MSSLKWKWFVCFGAFIIHFVIGGMNNTGGVLMSALVDEYGKPRGETAWVSSISNSVVYFFGPLSTFVIERYGSRIAITSGLILCITGLLTSAFANSLPVLYFTFGILWGTGGSLVYFSSFLTVVWYFKPSQYAFANGIGVSGAALGTLLMSPANERLFQTLGVSYTFLAFLGYHALLVIPLIAFRPKPAVEAGEPARLGQAANRRRRKRWNILRNYGYLALVTSLFLFMGVNMVPAIHMVRLGEDLGASKTAAALLISYMATASFTGRVVFGRLSDLRCCNRLRIFQVAILTIGISTALLSLAPSYPWLVGYVIVFGLFDGCYQALNAVVTCDIVGKENLPAAIGFVYFIMSFSRTVGPPIVGWMFDATNSYDTAFIMNGGICVLSTFILIWIPRLKRISERKASDTIDADTKGTDRREVVIANENSLKEENNNSPGTFIQEKADDPVYSTDLNINNAIGKSDDQQTYPIELAFPINQDILVAT